MYTGETARVEIPKLRARFTGTGDLFAALILAWGHEPLQVYLEDSIDTWYSSQLYFSCLECV